MSKTHNYQNLGKHVQRPKRTEMDSARISDMSLDMICVADINTATFIEVNPAFTEILGYSEEALLEKSFLDFVHPDDIDATRSVIEQKLRSGAKVINFENRYRCDDGSYRWLSWVSHPNVEQGITYAVARDITKWKENEKELKKGKALLDATGRMAGVGGWELDAKTLEVTWTDETYRIHEVPLDYKPTLQEAINFFHPEDKERLTRAIQQALDHGETYDMEIRLITAKGKHLWTRTKCASEMAAGKVTKLIGTFQDITDRKRAEETIRQSESFLTTLLDAIPIPIFLKDTGGRYIGVNKTLEQFLGKRKDELIGKTVFDIKPPDLASICSAKDQALLKTGEKQQYESQIQNSSGDRRNVLFNKAIFHDSGGNVGGLIGAIQDITDQRKTGQALFESKEKLSSIVDNLIDSIIVTGSNGIVKFVNNAACEFFEREKDDFIEASFGFPVMVNNIFEIATNPVSGKIRHAEAKTTSIDWDGESSFLISLRDITERNRALEEREKTNKHLQQIDKIESIGNLAGGIAHDFNNMLSVILGYGEELMDALHATDPLRDAVKEIVDAGRRSADLTRQLLAFSRRQTLQPEVLHLNAIVENIEKLIRRLIGEDIDLASNLSDDVAYVKVDPGQVEQVIVNLAVNARDAMPQGGKLTIETANAELDEQYASSHAGVIPGEYVMLSITDSGCGMDKETIAKVFEPFFTTKQKGKGTGLGLATVYGIVKQSGGNIWVYSERDKGTAFKIYLPQTTEKLPGEKTSRRDESISGNGELVLVVEDEPSLRKLCQTMLELLNYKATVAANGGEALLLIEEKNLNPDLIITDVVMPEMSGKVLVDRLKKRLPNLKVLYMSGYTDNAIVHHGVLDPGTPFVQKPFSKSKLAKAIRSVLIGG